MEWGPMATKHEVIWISDDPFTQNPMELMDSSTVQHLFRDNKYHSQQLTFKQLDHFIFQNVNLLFKMLSTLN